MNLFKKPAKSVKKSTKRRPVKGGKKAAKSANPPKGKGAHLLWYLNPQRFRDYWFTKPGLKTIAKISAVAAGVLVLIIIGLFLYFAKDLPSPGQINARALEQTTRFYDRTGKHILYEVFGDQNRTYIELNNMGDHIQKATIAVEDKNFYKQGAFSATGIIRAAINNALGRGGVQGGSTITQQYVKNALLTPERTLTRKIKELIISIQIEQLYDKNDILELYLNEIPYGAQAYGVQAASQMYFSKDANKLTLDEAALLAALPQAPTYYSPYGQHEDELVARQEKVLRLMAEQGYISQEEADKAIKVNTLKKINETPAAYRNVTAPHFVLQIQEELEEKYGTKLVTEGGLHIITTLDLDKQKAAEKAIKDGIAAVEAGGGNNAALVAADPDTGQVLALVGSRNFNHPKFGAFNVATSPRQPGSSFKPYVYATAFASKDWGAGSIMYDVSTNFNGYKPNNFDNRFRGAMPVRKALAESRNIPAVKMLYIAGIDPVLETARDLGITTLEGSTYYGLSLGLGSAEVKLFDHVNGYSAFANGGVHRDPVTILKVTEPNGNVLEEYEKPKGKQVLDPQVAYLISSILSDNNARAVTFGFNNPNLSVPGHTVAIKTGTTDDQKDGWMMGYTPSLVAGVWTGHNQNQEMSIATSNMTGPIFTQFMSKALAGKPNEQFKRPNGIKSVTLDAFTGDIATSNSRSTVTDIFPSWYEARKNTSIKTATIDTISKKLATDCTPVRARQEVSSIGLRPEIPASDFMYGFWNPGVQALASSLGVRGGASIPTAKDDVHSCNDKKPEATLSATAQGNKIEVSADVTKGTFGIKSVQISYNGKVIKTCSTAGECKVTYTPSAPGKYTFKVLVIDKGLYDTEATASIVYTEPGDEGDPEE